MSALALLGDAISERKLLVRYLLARREGPTTTALR